MRGRFFFFRDADYSGLSIIPGYHFSFFRAVDALSFLQVRQVSDLHFSAVVGLRFRQLDCRGRGTFCGILCCSAMCSERGLPVALF